MNVLKMRIIILYNAMNNYCYGTYHFSFYDRLKSDKINLIKAFTSIDKIEVIGYNNND